MEWILTIDYHYEDLNRLSDILRQSQSFVALPRGDIYNFHNYLVPTSPLHNTSAILDRNFYTRITNLIEGKDVPQNEIGDYRWAAAVMAFCQIADIKFHYGSSLQELASTHGGGDAAEEFEAFHYADNSDPKQFLDYALGRTYRIAKPSADSIAPPKKVPPSSLFEQRIYEFRINYIMSLKIALIEEEQVGGVPSMISFIDWMDDEFMLGASALQFANLLLSPSRMKKMLKKKRIEDIKNTAWDFALIQNWCSEAITFEHTKEHVYLITRDKVVRYIANRLFAADEPEFRGFIVDAWKSDHKGGQQVYDRYMVLHTKLAKTMQNRFKKYTDEERAQFKKRRPFSDEQLDAITQELEHKYSSLRKDKGNS